jgi:hypothetical protein
LSKYPKVVVNAWVPRVLRKGGGTILPQCGKSGAFGLLYQTRAQAQVVVDACERSTKGSVGSALRAKVTIEFTEDEKGG